jgi:hypothetical protein
VAPGEKIVAHLQRLSALTSFQNFQGSAANPEFPQITKASLLANGTLVARRSTRRYAGLFY